MRHANFVDLIGVALIRDQLHVTMNGWRYSCKQATVHLIKIAILRDACFVIQMGIFYAGFGNALRLGIKLNCIRRVTKLLQGKINCSEPIGFHGR